MTTRPTTASIGFDLLKIKFKFNLSKVTEFNVTRAVRTMDENSVKVVMLFNDPGVHTGGCSGDGRQEERRDISSSSSIQVLNQGREGRKSGKRKPRRG